MGPNSTVCCLAIPSFPNKWVGDTSAKERIKTVGRLRVAVMDGRQNNSDPSSPFKFYE